MTAIGFVMLVLAHPLFNLLGSRPGRQLNLADYAGWALSVLGGIFVTTGIARWLWEVMP